MKNFVIWPVVLLALAATAHNKAAESAEPGKAPQKSGAGGKAEGTPKELAVDRGGGVKMEMVLVPAGEFKMGSGESAKDTAAFFNKTHGKNLRAGYVENEHPQHRVRITKPFYLGIYHVTRGQFRQFVEDSGYETDAEKGKKPGAWGWDPDTKGFRFNKKYSWRNAGFEQTDEHPVVNVSWNDAVAFCKWLSRREGKTYRLPTEAEWEYACRAGTTTRYYSGDDPETLAKVGNVADATSKAKFPHLKHTIKASDNYVFTSPVGKFKPNAFGLYDMHGNAWQWYADWYRSAYYAISLANDPTGPDSGDVHVLWGGSWSGRPDDTRSAQRERSEPNGRNVGFAGFRVAKTPYQDGVLPASVQNPDGRAAGGGNGRMRSRRTCSHMCVQAIGTAILASTVLVATTAIGCQHAEIESNGYDSPQEAGEAFIEAMTKKDWKTGFRCFTREDQDLAIAHVITMTLFVAAHDKKKEQAAEAILKKYGFERAKAEEAAKTASSRAKVNRAKPNWKPVVKVFVDQIEDKELLFTSTLTWVAESYGGRGRADACALQDLKSTDDTATGKLKLTRPQYTVRFRKVDGRWFMALPEVEYRPSGWNDVFLMDFLDAMHGWRM